MDLLKTGADSLAVVSGTDTLWLHSHYVLDTPLYSPVSDSSRAQDAAPVLLNEGTTGLMAKGSISRGIQISTNASVSLQSSMYIKIDGKLSENYWVRGTLSEKTSPLQPIGNTRRLNDFDRVLIQVEGPSVQADVGDIDLAMINGRFGKMTRSIEGLHLKGNMPNVSAEMSLGFSYGRSHLMEIQGKDGKQGPYRLSGMNGEKYIIILAGSEEVRIDNEIMQRGAEDDYVIDYNAAEIHFTQNRLLSSNSRISVEFEYVPDIYLASYTFGKQLVGGQVNFGSKHETPAYLNVSWQELKDDGNNPLGNIEAEDLETIFQDLDEATNVTWISGIVMDSLNGDYNLDPTGQLVFVGSGNGSRRVSFTFVGLEQGEYRKALNADTSYFVYDTLNGEYLPAQKYVAPGSHSVLAFSGGASLGLFQLDADLGVSQSVQNLYARVGNPSERLAWHVVGGMDHEKVALLFGDKYYARDFQSHDPLESIEYYRKWQIDPRLNQAERLNYTSLRLGAEDEAHIKADLSQMTREDVVQGEQILVNAQTDLNLDHWISSQSAITLLDSLIRNEHDLYGQVTLGELNVTGHINLEEGRISNYYPGNDHFEYGLALNYTLNDRQGVQLSADQRQDYRFEDQQQGIFADNQFHDWTERRRDYAIQYDFRELLHSQGLLQFKLRTQENDSSNANSYYLGKARVSSRFLEDRLTLLEDLLIDEEHIPLYDYHYVEVDTGYGEFSYDPLINDYIPISGGRYVRQRLFSDIEEQVRKIENKASLQFLSKTFRDPLKSGFKLALRHESMDQSKVQSASEVQKRSFLNTDLQFVNQDQSLWKEVGYQYREANSTSALYSFGLEQSSYRIHTVRSDLHWNARHASTVSLEREERSRKLEYNSLAAEDWMALRPAWKQTLILSPQQRIEAIYRYSVVADNHLDQSYSEQYFQLKHELKFARRGRLSQDVESATVQADVAGIPYAVFSGRQPGHNWKYGLNGRYIFSSRFQIMVNYSIKKRGSVRSEQFLKVEGRTHF